MLAHLIETCGLKCQINPHIEIKNFQKEKNEDEKREK